MVAPLLALLLAATTPVIETKPAVFHSGRPKAARFRRPRRSRFAAARSPPRRGTIFRRSRRPNGRRPRERDAAAELRRKVPAEKVGIARHSAGTVGFAGLPFDLGSGGARGPSSGGCFERVPRRPPDVDGRLLLGRRRGAAPPHRGTLACPRAAASSCYSATGEAHGPYTFDRGTRPEGFWTNTVFAQEIFLEVQFPAGARGRLRRRRGSRSRRSSPRAPRLRAGLRGSGRTGRRPSSASSTRPA